jgi:hypothetical protein
MRRLVLKRFIVGLESQVGRERALESWSRNDEDATRMTASDWVNSRAFLVMAPFFFCGSLLLF